MITGVGLAVSGLGAIDDLLSSSPPESGGFDPSTALQGGTMRHKDRASRLALTAATAALRDAGWSAPTDPGDDDATFRRPGDRAAVVVSSNLGNLDSVCRFVDTIRLGSSAELNPTGLPHTSINAIAGWLAIALSCRGPNVTVSNGDTSGLDALASACNLIAADRADMVVVVGVEPATDVVERLYRENDDHRWLDGAAAVVVESVGPDRTGRAAPRATISGYSRGTDVDEALRAASKSSPRPVEFFLASDLPGKRFPQSLPASAQVVDVTSLLGRCSGALGVLQCAAAVARLARGDQGAVLTVIGGGDAAAALLLTRC